VRPRDVEDGVPIYAKQGLKALEEWLSHDGVKNIQAVNAASLRRGRERETRRRRLDFAQYIGRDADHDQAADE